MWDRFNLSSCRNTKSDFYVPSTSWHFAYSIILLMCNMDINSGFNVNTKGTNLFNLIWLKSSTLQFHRWNSRFPQRHISNTNLPHLQLNSSPSGSWFSWIGSMVECAFVSFHTIPGMFACYTGSIHTYWGSQIVLVTWLAFCKFWKRREHVLRYKTMKLKHSGITEKYCSWNILR